jgi:hypothetical protein
MKITVDTDYIDGVVLFVPHEHLEPNQVRELQIVLQESQVVVLPAGRIICGEGLETLPVRHP